MRHSQFSASTSDLVYDEAALGRPDFRIAAAQAAASLAQRLCLWELYAGAVEEEILIEQEQEKCSQSIARAEEAIRVLSAPGCEEVLAGFVLDWFKRGGFIDDVNPVIPALVERGLVDNLLKVAEKSSGEARAKLHYTAAFVKINREASEARKLLDLCTITYLYSERPDRIIEPGYLLAQICIGLEDYAGALDWCTWLRPWMIAWERWQDFASCLDIEAEVYQQAKLTSVAALRRKEAEEIRKQHEEPAQSAGA